MPRFNVQMMYWTEGQHENYEELELEACGSIDAMNTAENRVLNAHPQADHARAIECDLIEDPNADARRQAEPSAADVASMNKLS